MWPRRLGKGHPRLPHAPSSPVRIGCNDAAVQQGRNTMSKRRKPPADTIEISWHIDDVKEVRPDLTDAQAREVLVLADREHDATVGINWDVLRFHADYLFPEEG
jgi:hypothetical protein